MAERTKFLSYCVYSGVISALVYPIEAHWIWGGENNADKTETEVKNNSNVKYAGNRFNNFQQRDKKSADWYNTLLNNND